MNDHIHLFATNAEFTSAYTNDYAEPWVSYCMETSGLSYNKATTPPPVDYRSMPLTFEITEGNGSMTLCQMELDDSTLYYRINDGEWHEITEWEEGEGEPTFTLSGIQEHDKVQFKGNYWATEGSNGKSFFNDITNSLKYNLYGNIMSLVSADNYAAMTSFPDSDITFFSMFCYLSGLISAENLILPATTLNVWSYGSLFQYCTSLIAAPALPATGLAGCCYGYMFESCESLTTAPELPATTLARACYYYTFCSCTNLNYIKCLATDISADGCTEGWISGVQTNSGTFVKPSTTDWSSKTGNDGIPSNWTVEDAS